MLDFQYSSLSDASIFDEHHSYKKGAQKTLIDSNNLKVALKV